MINHIAFGVIIDDIVFPDGRTQMGVLGGGGAQTAWGMAAALGSGERVGLVAGIGQDADADWFAPLTAAGINLDGLRRTEYPTPRAWQITERDGRRTQVWRTPPQHLGQQLGKSWDILPESYRGAQHFHWGIHPEEDRSLPFAQQLHSMGKTVSLEPFKPAARPLSPQERAAIFSACNVFSPTPEELSSMLDANLTQGDALHEFQLAAGEFMVLRQGADGATAYDVAQGRYLHVPAITTTVVDEVGAGNAFCGAFLARLEDGCAEAVCHGAVAASFMIEQIGLPPHLPEPGEYQRRLNVLRQHITTRLEGHDADRG